MPRKFTKGSKKFAEDSSNPYAKAFDKPGEFLASCYVKEQSNNNSLDYNYLLIDHVTESKVKFDYWVKEFFVEPKKSGKSHFSRCLFIMYCTELNVDSDFMVSNIKDFLISKNINKVIKWNNKAKKYGYYSLIFDNNVDTNEKSNLLGKIQSFSFKAEKRITPAHDELVRYFNAFYKYKNSCKRLLEVLYDFSYGFYPARNLDWIKNRIQYLNIVAENKSYFSEFIKDVKSWTPSVFTIEQRIEYLSKFNIFLTAEQQEIYEKIINLDNSAWNINDFRVELLEASAFDIFETITKGSNKYEAIKFEIKKWDLSIESKEEPQEFQANERIAPKNDLSTLRIQIENTDKKAISTDNDFEGIQDDHISISFEPNRINLSEEIEPVFKTEFTFSNSCSDIIMFNEEDLGRANEFAESSQNYDQDVVHAENISNETRNFIHETDDQEDIEFQFEPSESSDSSELKIIDNKLHISKDFNFQNKIDNVSYIPKEKPIDKNEENLSSAVQIEDKHKDETNKDVSLKKEEKSELIEPEKPADNIIDSPSVYKLLFYKYRYKSFNPYTARASLFNAKKRPEKNNWNEAILTLIDNKILYHVDNLDSQRLVRFNYALKNKKSLSHDHLISKMICFSKNNFFSLSAFRKNLSFSYRPSLIELYSIFEDLQSDGTLIKSGFEYNKEKTPINKL